MIQPKLPFLIPIVLFVVGCKQVTIIGHWHRIWPDSTKQKYYYGKDEGDLTVCADATYFIKGNSTAPKYDTIPGWHVGGDENLYWKISDHKYLTLYYDSTFALKNLYLPFTIIHLSKKRLELSVSGSHYTQKYIRN